jgi:hypothetical protein
VRWFAILIALVGCRLRFGEETDAHLADAELPHIQTAPGWSVRVFADFSDSFTYASADFIDGPEHTLATAENIVYVLETNRALDRDRVLVFTSP